MTSRSLKVGFIPSAAVSRGDMDESGLIQAARKGDLAAFNQLVLKYQNLVFHQAYTLLGTQDLAEDFTQEAFIQAYKHLAKFRDGSFKAWLMRIVTNACYDELRRWKNKVMIPLVPSDEEGDEFESPEWLVDQGASVEEQVEQSELNAVLQRFIAELPLNFRLAITLVDVLGLDYAEAAHSLSVPVGTLKSRVARGRLELRERLMEIAQIFPKASPVQAALM